ncbi:NADH-quinone oxidoreductase subunit L [Phycicoccus sp. BSK3Z-2]|uniref:NADH-quinone oxidoreductase subunit L n=1 Tax=Phycicoccus avicenniae TaxID=2828860 RepID=A0A941D6M2_9MICO|nr:proton-conducting transporter membrane subunit [Phycicoccus avicenniae]MBR7742421.1 NADH-quinone oxidoreductase subunit L [Phycicoccus avicenniae]
MTDALLWALPVLPAVVGGLLLLVPIRHPHAVVVGVGTAVLSTTLAVVAGTSGAEVAVPFVAGADLGLALRGPGVLLAPAVTAVTALALLAAPDQVRGSAARFHGLMLLFCAAALVTVAATTLPALLLGWEVMGAMSYALIGFRWRDPHRVESGLTAFVATRGADLGLYVATGAALAGGAGTALDDLAAASPGWRSVVAAGLVVAALGKSAQLVLAFWLARAMAGPAPVSALLHSAAMVALGGYLLLRVEPLLAATSWAGPTVAWVGALSTVLLGLVALGQRDLKQLLAASTSAQLGFVVLAAGVGGVVAGTTHLLAHAATKAALFLVAGAWLAAHGTKQLAGLRGAVRRHRGLRVLASLALLSLAGVPPLSLWATKDLVLAAAFARSPALGVVAVLGAALSAAYAGVVLRVLWAPVTDAEAREASRLRGSEEPASGRVGPSTAVAVAVLIVAAALGGLVAVPAVGETVAGVVGASATGPGPLAAASGVLALAVVAAVWARPPGSWARARAWGGVEAAVRGGLVAPTLRLADAAARVDEGLARTVRAVPAVVHRLAATVAAGERSVLEAAVDRAAGGTVRVAQVARRGDERRVHGAVLAVAGAARRAGEAARRPQTGQLHQYYVQAVALVALGTVLLLVAR